MDPLERFLRIFFLFVGAAVVAGAAWIMVRMDEAARSQGGRWYAAAGALILLGAMDMQLRRVRARTGVDPDVGREFWPYRLASVLLLVSSAVVLLGLAYFLP